MILASTESANRFRRRGLIQPVAVTFGDRFSLWMRLTSSRILVLLSIPQSVWWVSHRPRLSIDKSTQNGANLGKGNLSKSNAREKHCSYTTVSGYGLGLGVRILSGTSKFGSSLVAKRPWNYVCYLIGKSEPEKSRNVGDFVPHAPAFGNLTTNARYDLLAP